MTQKSHCWAYTLKVKVSQSCLTFCDTKHVICVLNSSIALPVRWGIKMLLEGIKQNNIKRQHLAHGTFSVTADLLGIKEE